MLVSTSRTNPSPALVLELLHRLGSIIKDHIGILSEDAIRKNFIIIYELLDEAIDYGYPQNASTESLKTFVLNEPTVVLPPVPPPSSGPLSFRCNSTFLPEVCALSNAFFPRSRILRLIPHC